MEKIRDLRAPWEAARDAEQHQFVQLSLYRLVGIFIFMSVAGLIVETLVSYPIDGVWKDRAGFVWGPLSPIYGLGCVLLTVLLNNLVDAPNRTIFITGAVGGASFEFAAGWFFEKAFGIVAWSYAGRPGNIGNHTCVGMAIVWGLIGLVWMRVLLPRVVALLDRVPARFQGPLAVAGLAFLIADTVVTLTAFDCWYERDTGQVPDTPVERYFERNYGDAFMDERFQTMSLYADLANRDED